MDFIIIRYLHFIAILMLFSGLVLQHNLVKDTLPASKLKAVSITDGIVGLSAVVALITGLAMWWWVGKPAEFYTKNPLFHVKVTLFILAFALSLKPTLFFIKARKRATDVVVPKSIVMIIRTEMLIVLIMPILAILMALGVGLKTA